MLDLLETSPKDWHFFAKGNANALFQYQGDNTDFQRFLLRLRLEKNTQQYVSVAELDAFIKNTCEPLFPRQIVDTQMIEVPEQFRTQLATPGFTLMSTEPHGFLTFNVRAGGNFQSYKLLKYCALHVGSTRKGSESGNEIESVLFEFKPKWLYEPKEKYCRTCLLKQSKGHKRHFCCLDLLREDRQEQGVHDLLSEVPKEVLDQLDREEIPLAQVILEFVREKGNVLQQLKLNEAVGEEDSILALNSEKDVLEKLSLVMTLRDVGLFLKVMRFDDNYSRESDYYYYKHNDKTYEVSSCLYDLDLKSSARFTHWKAIEEELQSYYNSDTSDWPQCRMNS